MRQVADQQGPPQPAPAHPHRREAAQVLVLRQGVQQAGQPDAARARPHRGAPLHVRDVREVLLAALHARDPQALPHGPAAVRLPALPEGLRVQGTAHLSPEEQLLPVRLPRPALRPRGPTKSPVFLFFSHFLGSELVPFVCKYFCAVN